MKTNHRVHPLIGAALFACALGPLPAIRAQGGSLTPPGAPAPTMKTLDQIEPRTIVNATNTPGDANNTFIISTPGSYYLTGNVTGEPDKHGISIQADDVTLDLNGFALVSGGAGAFRGIDVPTAQKNVAIRNGTVRGWAGGGVRADTVVGALIEKVLASDNTGATGIFVGLGGLVRDCVANANGAGFQSGDRAQFLSCVSTVNTGRGFDCGSYVTLLDCTSSRNGSTAIRVLGSSSLQRCSATRSNADGGIVAGPDGTLTACTGSNNVGLGIYADDGCTITGCTASNNSGPAGLGISATNSTITDCTARANARDGIYNGGGSVAGCTASQNGTTGIYGDSVTHCTARFNGGHGIQGNGAVVGCSVDNNGVYGIYAPEGSVSNCHARNNGDSGIYAHSGSVTHCVAIDNDSYGIECQSGVVAFCKASSNSTANYSAIGSTVTGNY